MPQLSFNQFRTFFLKLKKDSVGQDLIEYALLSGFLVIAIWALFPTGIVPSISHVFSRLVNIASTLVP
jgi:Flp pilus assembly pilin Flp